MFTVQEAAAEIAERLRQPNSWTKRAYRRRNLFGSGRDAFCATGHAKVVTECEAQAILSYWGPDGINPQSSLGVDLGWAVRAKIEQEYPEWLLSLDVENPWSDVIQWNDDAWRTKGEVIRIFEKVAADETL